MAMTSRSFLSGECHHKPTRREVDVFKTILVATDLGDASEEALTVAVQLARDHSAALRLAHVVKDPASEPWAVESYGVDFGALMADMLAAAKQGLAAQVQRIVPPLADIRADVIVGRAATEIIRYAAKTSADLIVLGSHGRGPVRRAFLGSVADQVLRQAACPVLVVRPVAAAAPHAVGDAA